MQERGLEAFRAVQERASQVRLINDRPFQIRAIKNDFFEIDLVRWTIHRLKQHRKRAEYRNSFVFEVSSREIWNNMRIGFPPRIPCLSPFIKLCKVVRTSHQTFQEGIMGWSCHSGS